MRTSGGVRPKRAAAAAVVAILAGCTTSTTPSPGPTPAASSRAVASPSASPISSPLVVAGNLGVAPGRCPGPRPRLRAVAAAYGKVMGSGPLRGGPYARLKTRTNTLHAPDAPRTDVGWRIKILWLVRPDQTQPVTIEGSGGSPGGPVVFEVSDAKPTTTARLDPAHPGVAPEKGHWLEYPSYASFPGAGCYRLSARWVGGGWDLGFGFGR